MAFLRTRTASPWDVPNADAVVITGLTSAQIDGNFKSLDNAKAETNQAMFIGTTSVPINRGSGILTLTGVSIGGNAGTATILENTRKINGTDFNGSVNITTANWGAERNITIGLGTKSINGSGEVTYTLGEIGAAATNQTMHIGTTSVAINRGSGTLALTGISSISNNGDITIGSSTNQTVLEGSSILATKIKAIHFNSALTTLTANSGTIDCSIGAYFMQTISSNVTYSFINVPSGGIAYGMIIEINHTSGILTWPSSVRWPNDIAPTLTTGKTHLFVFVTDDGGARWRGSSLINYTT